MQKFTQEYYSNYSIDQIYDLIVDIESYPKFLPWCVAAQILEETKEEITADLIISFKAFTEHYRSKVVLDPPGKRHAGVKVYLVHGPFKHLYNEWKLSRAGKKTKINFYIDFEFKSVLLEKLIGLFFSEACKKMIFAFEKRADELYSNE